MNVELNLQAIKEAVEERLGKINDDNRITLVHDQLFFYYNSFNVILGKQGTGKTTFILTEMIKLSNINSKYKKIIYVSANEGKDMTFLALKKFITIPTYVLDFDQATEALEQYFQTENKDGDHIIVIIEDGSFLLEKNNPTWFQWICKLRHLKMTLFLNLHIWKSLSPSLKTQIGCVLVFKGFSKEVFQRIFRQTASDFNWDVGFSLYTTMEDRQMLKIDNINGKIKIINMF